MTRKRRYLISVGIPVGCVCAVLAVFVKLPPQPGVTKANFDRIQEGMTRENVGELLGRQSPLEILFDNEVTVIWSADDGAWAVIDFNEDVVVSKSWRPSTESIPDKLRRWLHLPK